jgi:hypothetical protein
MWSFASQAQIDTPRPLVADSCSSAATVQTQTVMLAEYLTSDASRAEIARRTGIPAEQLSVTTPSTDVPTRQSPLVIAAQEVANMSTPYTVTAGPWTNTPLLTLIVSGPDAKVASRLSTNAMQVLSDGVSGRVRTAKSEIVVRQLGAPQVGSWINAGRSRMIGAGLAVFLFAAWCGGLVLTTGFARLWRAGGRPPAAAR